MALKWTEGMDLSPDNLNRTGGYAETVLSTMSLSEINTVLSDVSSDGGGTVAFRNGVYSFSGDLVVPSNVGIIGESFGGTILSFTGNYGINGSGTFIYNTGTVSATKGSNEIVGSGTSWVANLAEGQEILIDGFYYEIASIEDDTNLTITRPYPYASISDVSYVVAEPTSSIVINDFFITNTTSLDGYGIKLEYNKFSFLRRNAMIAVGDAYVLKDCSIVGLNDTGINLCDTGFNMDNAGSVAIQEVSGDCSTANLDLKDCKRCYISDVGAYSATKGLVIDGGYKLSFNSIWAGDNTTGVEIKNSQEVSFNSSFIFGNTTGLTIDADCDDTKITGTSFDNDTNITDLGQGTIISGCTPDSLNTITQFKVGNVLIFKDKTENSVQFDLSKIKEAQTGKGGELRIKFDMRSTVNDGSVQSQIYRNGVAVGTLRTQTSSSFITYSEDISGWSAEDLIQIYGKYTGAGEGQVVIKNFSIYVDKSDIIVSA